MTASPERDCDQPELPRSLPLTSPHARADSSPVDEWDHGAIGSSYELFAAALGNLEWLQFCLNRDRGEIPTDNKVRPWSAEARTEVPITTTKSFLHGGHLAKRCPFLDILS